MNNCNYSSCQQISYLQDVLNIKENEIVRMKSEREEMLREIQRLRITISDLEKSNKKLRKINADLRRNGTSEKCFDKIKESNQ